MSTKDYEIRIWYSPLKGDECYIAQVVEMPGVTSHGDTPEEAAAQIRKALELTLEVLLEAGDAPPAPRRISGITGAALGRMGGKARTSAKIAASRANGRKGGRPRNQPARSVSTVR
ncbi:MAG: type II toxin-antitoxin system HicB family antitoxin [Opitutaceae bacterium]|nr:type II toxin-antitoxin system HicB family antitoxin [Opitutaceae bacterium]